jgi:hypothetical protein
MLDTNLLSHLRISIIFLGRKQIQKYSKKGHHPLSTVTDTFKQWKDDVSKLQYQVK